MRGLRTRAAVLGAAAMLAAASPAGASTLIGRTAAPGEGPGGLCGGLVLTQWSLDFRARMTADGVVTHLRTVGAGPAGQAVTLRVLRPTGANTVAAVDAASALLGPQGVADADVRIVVKAGDVVGISSPESFVCGAPTAGADSVGSGSADGATFSAAGLYIGNLANVQATYEPDADADGYGDDSQDGCPTDAAIRATGCIADVRLTSAVTAPAITAGGTTALLATVSNAAGVPASGVRLTGSISGPATITAIVGGAAACAAGPAIDCALGSLPAGGKVTVAIVVRGDAAGVVTASLTTASTGADPDPTNNATAASVQVAAAPAGRLVTRCRVPALRGQSVSVARALLTGAGCRLGRRTTRRLPRSGHLRVVRQSLRAGSVRPLDTRVDVTLVRARV